MGRHTYPCPVCGNRQSVEAPNGQAVNAAPCAGCAEALSQLAGNKNLKPEEVTKATGATLDQVKAYRTAHQL